MARAAKSFERMESKYKPLPTVLVICEDKKSGKNYIEDAATHYRINVRVTVAHIGKTDPGNIVREGIKRLRQYDKVFCVIDRDDHANWQSALDMARGRVRLFVLPSYPCFEYWLILHFHEYRKPYCKEGRRSAGECCVADLVKCDGMHGYDKGGDESIFDALIDRLPAARKRARHILNDARTVGSLNPSTQVHEIIDFFEELETALHDA